MMELWIISCGSEEDRGARGWNGTEMGVGAL